MREHCRNAQRVADFLAVHPLVKKVIYPGMTADDPTERTESYLVGGRGGLVGFELKTRDAEEGARFIDALQMNYNVANIGDTRTLALEQATPTHQKLARTRAVSGKSRTGGVVTRGWGNNQKKKKKK